jgi:hypothetical protein
MEKREHPEDVPPFPLFAGQVDGTDLSSNQVATSSTLLAAIAAAPTCRVGLVSDTHAVYDPLLVQQFLDSGVEIIVHAGDVGQHGGHEEVLARMRHDAGARTPVVAIRGNVDDIGEAQRTLPEETTLTLAGHRVLVTHARPSALRLEQLRAGGGGDDPPVDVVVCGHSHKAEVDDDPGRTAGILVINPGSAGPARFSLPRTYAQLTLTAGVPPAATHVEIFELARKAPPKVTARVKVAKGFKGGGEVMEEDVEGIEAHLGKGAFDGVKGARSDELVRGLIAASTSMPESGESGRSCGGDDGGNTGMVGGGSGDGCSWGELVASSEVAVYPHMCTHANRLSALTSPIDRAHAAQHARAVRPIITAGTLALLRDFIDIKQSAPAGGLGATGPEQRLYGGDAYHSRGGHADKHAVATLVHRLLIDRPLMFMNPTDDFELRDDGERGRGGFEAVGTAAVGLVVHVKTARENLGVDGRKRHQCQCLQPLSLGKRFNSNVVKAVKRCLR